MAMRRGGGEVIASESAGAFSSAAKGESLEDTIRVLSGYEPDIIILRHRDEGSAAKAAQFSSVPIVNAGDGSNEHPTQALLDLFTIWEARQLGKLPGRLLVHFWGDNAKSRAVHSAAWLLAKHGRALGLVIECIFFGGPYEECALPPSELHDEIISFVGTGRLTNQGLGTPTHVMYLTRVQKERYAKSEKLTRRAPPGDPEEHHWPLVFERGHAASVDGIILHPLPRVDEMSREVDQSSRPWYFTQAENGLYVRLALLELMLGVLS
jgi:aspartate carbamoyltransferase catalytic subunit